MIRIGEAIRIVLSQTNRLPTESIPIDTVSGRVLAEDILADSDLPPFDRAQMEGYAVRADDVENTPARLRIVGESAAGAGWHHEMKAGEAVRIMTGAPVPTGADAVQQVELTREVDGNAIVEILTPVEVGRSIVNRAAEIKAGETVLRAGEDINAAMIATLASFGFAIPTTIRSRRTRRWPARVSSVCRWPAMTRKNSRDKLERQPDDPMCSSLPVAFRWASTISLKPH